MTIRINLIGAGRVGQTLIELIKPLPSYQLQAICSQHYHRDDIPVVRRITELPSADIFLLTVADKDIETSAIAIRENYQNTILAHCSGGLKASALNPHNRPDLQVASVHPPICIQNPTLATTQLAQGFCCIEGDHSAVKQLTQLFASFGTQLQRIDPKEKIAYHAANTLIGNYLITLAKAAHDQLTAIGIDNDFAKKIVEQLIDSATDNLKCETNYRNALTGPIARGDIDTVKNHILALKPEIKALYCQMGLQTIEITNHSEAIKKKLRQVLS